MESRIFEERLFFIERRLSKIESSLKLSPPLPDITPAPQNQQDRLITRAVPLSDAQINAKPGNWLGIIAVICFVVAAAFIVKLSIESGWLTPARQIGLAALLGLGLIGAGFSLLGSDRAYAGLLPGAGVIILYLTTFAAHRYYALIPFEVAMIMTGVVSCICIWIYTQIKHDAYVITAAVGAYVAPVILGFHADAVFSLYYFLICSVVFAAISVWEQSRVLGLVSAYLAILMTGLAGMDLGQDQLVAGMLAVHFFIFSVGTYLYTTKNRLMLATHEAWAFLPVLLIFYILEYSFIDRIAPGLAPWISLAFAAMLISLYSLAKKYFPEGLNSQSLIVAFASIVCFHSIYLELLPDGIRPWLFVIIMLGFGFLPATFFAGKRNVGWCFPVLAIFAILMIEYIAMVSQLLNGYNMALFVSFAALGSIWIVLASAGDRFSERIIYSQALLAAAHILGVLGLYRLTQESGSLAVSASWLFYGVAVIVLAFVRRDEVMAKSALFVLTFAAAKALLYDAASAPTVVRIFCLLLTGAVLYGCGLFMRRIGSWRH